MLIPQTSIFSELPLIRIDSMMRGLLSWLQNDQQFPAESQKILHGWSEETSGDYLTSRGMWHDQRFMGWQTCNSLAKWCPAGLKYPTCSVHDFMSAWSLSYAAVASLIYHTFVGQKYKCKMCQGKGTFKTVIGFNNIKSSTVDNELTIFRQWSILSLTGQWQFSCNTMAIGAPLGNRHWPVNDNL